MFIYHYCCFGNIKKQVILVVIILISLQYCVKYVFEQLFRPEELVRTF